MRLGRYLDDIYTLLVADHVDLFSRLYSDFAFKFCPGLALTSQPTVDDDFTTDFCVTASRSHLIPKRQGKRVSIYYAFLVIQLLVCSQHPSFASPYSATSAYLL